jgi:hypothetical protein
MMDNHSRSQIRCWQINLQHSKHAVASVTADAAVQQTNLLILGQEPHLVKDRVSLKIKGFDVLSFGTKSRAFIAGHRKLNLKPLGIISDPDTAVALIEGEQNVLIASLYLDINQDINAQLSKLQEIRNLAREKSFAMILGLDSNAHSPLWGEATTNPRGEALEEWLMMNDDLIICNDGLEHTFVSTRAKSFIDITLTNKVELIRNWKVNTTFQFSDHRRIEFDVNFQVEIKLTRNFGKANWSLFQSILDSTHWIEPETMKSIR